MKNLFTTIIGCILTLTVISQSVSPEVISSSGAYYENASASLSWTLGEVATETYSNGGVTLTQGFQQPISIAISGINLSAIVFLEGPFNGVDMNADGSINSADKPVWVNEAGTIGYQNPDVTLDGQSDNKDKNNVFVGNIGESSQVPL